jgi:hypothetical protein
MHEKNIKLIAELSNIELMALEYFNEKDLPKNRKKRKP